MALIRIYNTTSSGGGGGKIYYANLGYRSVLNMIGSGSTFIPIYGIYPTTALQANDTTNFDARSFVLKKTSTFYSITVNTNTTQPATGDFNIYLAVDGVVSSLLVTIPAGSSAGHYEGIVTQSVLVDSKIAFFFENNATSNSAIILSVNLTYYAT